jgi:hypothetical protein
LPGYAKTNGKIISLLLAKVFTDRDEDSDIPLFNYQESIVLIQSVELVALPNAPSYQEKIYRAHLATGDSVDLFQAHWDVPLAPDSLIGMSVQAARQLRNERMLAVAQGHR